MGTPPQYPYPGKLDAECKFKAIYTLASAGVTILLSFARDSRKWQQRNNNSCCSYDDKDM